MSGTFIGVSLSEDSAFKLEKWCAESLIPNHNKIEDFHVTLVYSTDNLPEIEIPQYVNHLVLDKSSYEYAKFGDGSILVLKFKSDTLSKRWEILKKKYNFQYNHPTWIPHITLSYSVPEKYNINRLELPNFSIKLDGEYRKPFDANAYSK